MSTQPISITPDVLIPTDATIAALLNETPAVEAPATLAPTGPAPAVKDASQLAAKTVFLKPRFGVPGNSRKVTGDVLETDADKGLLKVSKQLLDSPQLEAIRKADTKMRTWLYNTCLPFDFGVMILPIGLIETAENRMAAFKDERAALVDAFIEAYPQLCADAANHLGSLYNSSEYPNAETVRAKFVFDWQYVSFGVPGQLKGISSALFQSEQEKAAKQMQAAQEEITALMRQSLYDMVSHLESKLTPGDDGKAKILRESAVKNLQDFLSTFELRNVTDDVELAAQVAKARELIDGTSAATLRSSDLFREKIRAGMAQITSQLSEMIEEKPGRLFREE